MPVRIKHLKCRVSVRSGRSGSPLHKAEKPEKPSLNYALPPVEARSEAVQPEPSKTVTDQHASSPSDQSQPLTGQADARAVADRVYELMKQEIQLGRQRGGAGR